MNARPEQELIMTLSSWRKLRSGSIVRSIRSGVYRRVIRAQSGCITLVMIQGGERRLWSGAYRHNIAGVSKTVYVSCDRAFFKVWRY
jgi:hypothetical protein